MSRNIQIVPAVLTSEASKLNSMLEQAKLFTDTVQIDLMDGLFVPSVSIASSCLQANPPRCKWEAHIMVSNPEKEIDKLVKAGAHKVIFHYEATGNPRMVISLIRHAGVKAGIALNPETDPSLLAQLLGTLDSVLFMSVNPGYYGAPFIPEVLGKITEFKKQNPGIELGIDGGVKESNISLIARSGVDYICVGSAIFLSSDPAKSYRNMVKLVNL